MIGKEDMTDNIEHKIKSYKDYT